MESSTTFLLTRAQLCWATTLLSTVGMTSPLARNDSICWVEDAKKDDNRACLRVDGASMRTSGSIGV